jgi:2-methylisocitrate lyase-like PEP mutase family enzyme
MTLRAEKVAVFRRLHERGCFVIPNPWDAGTARILEATGFPALATTSSGYAFTRGLSDGAMEITRDDMLTHAAALAAAADIPVSADMENGFADAPEGVAETVRLAAEAGLAGISIEDRARSGGAFYPFAEAVARIAAAVAAARQYDIVLTARADGLLEAAYDLGEAIRRLRAFAEAGAEVVYAPGVRDIDQLRQLCASVPAPVNHLAGLGPDGPGLAEIAATGVRRVSVGGGLTRAAMAAVRGLAEDLRGGDFTALHAAPPWQRLFSRAP